MATGGSGTGYTWSVSSGSLPPGFALSTAGVLSSTGSPAAAANSYSFAVRVTDSAGNTATQPLSLLIVAAAFPLQIATTSLPNATSGSPYSTTLMATGGSGTGYTWSVSSGSLPPGFALSTAGVLSSTGSPAAAANSYSFAVRVTDSAGNTATQPLSLLIVAAAFPLQIATTSLPNATSGSPYSTTLMATGGSGTGYTWSVSSGSLPPGFALSTAGVLSSTGSPAAAANSYSFAVRVTDSAGNTATQPLSLLVVGAAFPLQIVTTSLPNATSGSPYSTTLIATGGSGTGYTWSVSSGSLPAGFALSTAGALISTGSPAAAANSYSFAVRVTDSAGNTATRSLTVSIVVMTTVTYTYAGQPFSLTECLADWASNIPNYPYLVICAGGGNLTATVSFSNLPPRFTGIACVPSGGVSCPISVVSWSMTGLGVTLTSTTPNICIYRNGEVTSEYFVFTDGSITSWYFDAVTYNPDGICDSYQQDG